MLLLVTFFKYVGCMITWHIPVKPEGQMHMNPVARSRHVPSCRHGDDKHSLMLISHKVPEEDAEKKKSLSLAKSHTYQLYIK